MATSDPGERRDWTGRDLLGGLLLVPGVALAGVGGYFHVTLAAQVRAGRCDGCEPWHPLVVVAPLLVGVACLLLAGYLLSR